MVEMDLKNVLCNDPRLSLFIATEHKNMKSCNEFENYPVSRRKKKKI